MAGEDKPEAEAQASPPPAKKGKKGLLLVAIAAIVAGGGGTAGFLAIRGGSHGAPAVAVAEAHAEAESPALVTLDAFLVNLSDAGRDRYGKVSLRLGVLPAAKGKELQENELLHARVRDRILTLLTSRTAEELSGPLGKESLRHEIKAQIEPLLDGGTVADVLFAEFVVQ